jgi:hypothetical protein
MYNLNFDRHLKHLSLNPHFNTPFIIPSSMNGVDIESEEIDFPIQIPPHLSVRPFLFHLRQPFTQLKKLILPRGQTIWGLVSGFNASTAYFLNTRRRYLHIDELSLAGQLEVTNVHVLLPASKDNQDKQSDDATLWERLNEERAVMTFFDRDRNIYVLSLFFDHAYIIPSRTREETFNGIMPQLLPDYEDGLETFTTTCIQGEYVEKARKAIFVFYEKLRRRHRP